MHYEGILIGVVTFVVIGLFHPIVIKAEYHFSKRIWPVFAVAGAGFLLLSLLVDAIVPSTVLVVIGASALWSIRELFEQEKRVEKGWFPKKSEIKG